MRDNPQPTDDEIDNGLQPSRRVAVKFFLWVLAAFVSILLWNEFGPEREFLLLYFVFAVLCLDLIYLVFLFSRTLPWPLRLFITSFIIAFVFAPTVIVGEGGGAIVPAWLVLFARENGHYNLPVALKSGLLPIAAVCAVVMLVQLPFYWLCRKAKPAPPDRKPVRR